MTRPSDSSTMISPVEDHFEFGKNWTHFLSTLDDQRIADATRSVQSLLHTESLAQKRFLDAGSGSGLFSLVAHCLGANVTSFDLDSNSVACTRTLQDRYAPTAENWAILTGSLTDRAFLSTLGQYDVVYCWGVAHHTGAMWTCIENLSELVQPGGSIVLAIYNDQAYVSKIWQGVKQLYQRLPRVLQPLYVAGIGTLTFLKRLSVTLLACLLRLVTLRNPLVPFLNWAHESQARGMHGWYDLVDWVGGWPFEVAAPEAIFRFMRDQGFTLQELTTCSGHGCNEYVFQRTEDNPEPLRRSDDAA